MNPERRLALERFARSLHIELHEGDWELLDQALTHKSFAFEAETGADNERLEFLGDAVVGLVVSQAVYDELPDHDEGPLSQAKAAMVSRKTLGRRAGELGFGEVVRFGRGEARNEGPSRNSTLGGAFEAFVGALYLLQGFDAAAQWVRAHLLPSAQKEMLHGAAEDYKSRLQEWTQSHLNCLPHYHRVSESGPDHNKSFVVEVLIGGKVYGRSAGRRLKEAEHLAADQALRALLATSSEATPTDPKHAPADPNAAPTDPPTDP